jgi:hypothetical protein
MSTYYEQISAPGSHHLPDDSSNGHLCKSDSWTIYNIHYITQDTVNTYIGNMRTLVEKGFQGELMTTNIK